MNMQVSAADQFWSRVDRSDPTGCWPWKGNTTSDGYGTFTALAHRMSYELTYGAIPPDRVVDHLCRTRDCQNPDHLEAVTRGENVLRGEGLSAVNARKTHCLRGHPFDETNTYHHGGQRHCRSCRATYLERHNGH